MENVKKLVKEIEMGYGWATPDYIFAFLDISIQEKYLTCFILATKGKLLDYSPDQNIENGEPGKIKITPEDFLENYVLDEVY
jgi:hypothetical protein